MSNVFFSEEFGIDNFRPLFFVFFFCYPRVFKCTYLRECFCTFPETKLGVRRSDDAEVEIFCDFGVTIFEFRWQSFTNPFELATSTTENNVTAKISPKFLVRWPYRVPCKIMYRTLSSFSTFNLRVEHELRTHNSHMSCNINSSAVRKGVLFVVFCAS